MDIHTYGAVLSMLEDKLEVAANKEIASELGSVNEVYYAAVTDTLREVLDLLREAEGV